MQPNKFPAERTRQNITARSLLLRKKQLLMISKNRVILFIYDPNPEYCNPSLYRGLGLCYAFY